MSGPWAEAREFRLDIDAYRIRWPFFHGRILNYGYGLVFHKTAFTDAGFASDRAAMAGWSSQTLDRNYVRALCSAAYTAGQPAQTWNLWDDSDRDLAVANFRVLARQARLTGLKGILFDPEYYDLYGYSPWDFNDSRAPWRGMVPEKTFSECQQRIIELGAKVMAAIEAEAPGTRFMVTFGLGCLRRYSATVPFDPAALEGEPYGLYPSFLAGLASASVTCPIVDMQENYFESEEADFQKSVSFIQNDGPAKLLPEAFRAAYRSRLEWGFMLYANGMMGYDSAYLGYFMTPPERAAFIENMTYWALKNSSGGASGPLETIIYTERSTPMWGTSFDGQFYEPDPLLAAAIARGEEDYRTGTTPPHCQTIVANAWQRRNSPRCIVSQVYGSAGRAGAVFGSDFIELFNAEPVPIDITGWSLQYRPAGGAVWQSVPLSGRIDPGRYFLVGCHTPGGGTALPTADAVCSLDLDPAGGTIALVMGAQPLVGSCPSGQVRDRLGYGTATCYEGAVAEAPPSVAHALRRMDAACQDTDNNRLDFGAGEPIPRNSDSPANLCPNTTEPLILLTPNGGEVWRQGETRTLTWTSKLTGTLKIELLRGDTLLGVVATGVPAAAGAFTWTVGQLADGSYHSGPDLKIRISSGDGS